MASPSPASPGPRRNHAVAVQRIQKPHKDHHEHHVVPPLTTHSGCGSFHANFPNRRLSPAKCEDGSNSLLSSASGVSDGAGNLLASIGNTSNSIADFTGVQMPGAATGNELRGWDDNDQKAAEEAYKVFAGKPLDSLPVYDPLKPGELQRYKARLNELVAKYKGRETLNKDEMMEFAETVVPLMRFLAKSRAYRASAEKVPNITRDPRGQASVVVPAGMTMEIALLTYCNDHGLPAPWKGEKLSMRSSAPYMPQALRPLYADLHKYAATNPSAHYQMQSTVWWLRGGTCNFDALNQQQKGFIERLTLAA